MRKFAIEFNWAIIYTLASLLWAVLEKSLGYHGADIGRQGIFSMLFWLVLIPIYFLSIRDKRTNFYNGRATWAQLFLSGVILSVFAAILNILSLYIVLHVISPDFISNSVDYLVTQRKLEPEKAAIYAGYKSLLIQSVSSIISIGVLISSVVALFLKNSVVLMPTSDLRIKKSKSKRK